jgi:hypothetical protein
MVSPSWSLIELNFCRELDFSHLILARTSQLPRNGFLAWTGDPSCPSDQF